MSGRRRKEGIRKAKARSPPTTLDDIPDKLLKHILAGLSSQSSACIVRAAATCRRWRRLIGSGDYTYNLSLITPLHDGGHYTYNLSLITHGSLLLLAKNRRRGRFPELVVCEPVARRYVAIPLIPEKKYSRCLTVFFWNSVSNLSEFALRCVLHEAVDGAAGDVTTVRVYDFARYYWSHHRKYWNRWFPRKGAVDDGVNLRATESSLHFAGRATTCLFFGNEDDGAVLELHMRNHEPKLLQVFLPGNLCGGSYDRSAVRFVDGDQPNDVRLVSVIGGDLKVFLRREGTDVWELEKSLNLQDTTRDMARRKECNFGGGGAAKIVSAGTGYVVLTPAEETWLFSLELAMMEVERKHSRNRYAGEFCPKPQIPVAAVSRSAAAGGVHRRPRGSGAGGAAPPLAVEALMTRALTTEAVSPVARREREGSAALPPSPARAPATYYSGRGDLGGEDGRISAVARAAAEDVVAVAGRCGAAVAVARLGRR
uniref:F-box domain-containing protein n=1 Tax=Leersia perrieri TaxID=77586 RepID=A0A0D9XCI3_9ORYZ